MGCGSDRERRAAVVRTWLVAAVIVLLIAIVVDSFRSFEITETRKAYSELPVVVLVTRMVPNDKGEPITTYVRTDDGNEQPASTAGFVPVFLRSLKLRGALVLGDDAVCKIYYDATSRMTQAMVIRAPKADEARWVQIGRQSPCFLDYPRYVVEYHFVPGNTPIPTTPAHAESED